VPVLKRNHRQILAARPLGGKYTRYRIEGTPGLWLYVGATGTRTWYARYQMGAGAQQRRERWFRIGDAAAVSLEQAVKRSKQILTQAQVEERDPHLERAARRSSSQTFGDLFDGWFERHACQTAREVDPLSASNFDPSIA
jgi:hypothetical protein